MLFWSFTIFAGVAVVLTVGVHWWLRRRFRRGVPLSVHLTLLLVLVAGLNFTGHRLCETKEFLVRQINGLAPTFALEIQRMGHERLTLEADPQDPLYLRIIEAQKRWLTVNKELIADIYTFRVDDQGECRLIVDSETDYDHSGEYEGEREARTQIGESFGPAEAMAQTAMRGQVIFESEPTTDRWGTWVSAYAPLFRENGQVDAVLGIDFPAERWMAELSETLRDWMGLVGIIYLLILGGCVMLRYRKEAMTALQQARDCAEDASRAKSEFLANMSHEIRTPMTAILGYADLLTQEGLTDAERAEFAQTIRENGKHLLALISDILDLSKVEAGRMTLEQLPIDPRVLVSEVTELMRPRAEQKQLEFAWQVGAEVPPQFVGDPTRLRQVLVNLIGNAIKFTLRGRVRLTVTADEQALEFRISDTGIGMTAQELGLLFKPFQQADGSMTRRFGGSGLGLAICKRLADLMHAQLTVQSEKNIGSSFRFRLPLRPPAAVANVAAATSGLSSASACDLAA
jgi:signal transduction histidine kinase